MARERGLKAYEVTGDLLDEAARFAEEKEPGIGTEELRKLLDPETFIRTHSNKGGTADREARRMLLARTEELEAVRRDQQKRKQKLDEAEALRNKKVTQIIG
jgi:hypothetical protein